eukprot:2506919-Pleurochrysis_carterae.AAC.3
MRHQVHGKDSKEAPHHGAQRQELNELLVTLQEQAKLQFEPENEKHEQLLRSLWNTAFPGEEFELKSPKWTDIGFQGRDPTTDLRGAGLMGLRHLQLYFCEGMLPHDCPPGFPLALASINVTGFLQSYFHLNLVMVPGLESKSTQPTLESFLSACNSQPATLQVLHDRLLLHLAGEWRRLLLRKPLATLLDFSPLLQSTFAHAHGVLSRARAPWDMLDVAKALSGRRAPKRQQPRSLAVTLVMMVCTHLGCSQCCTPPHRVHPGRG